jgi:uncharacterized membrane protein YfcA
LTELLPRPALIFATALGSTLLGSISGGSSSLLTTAAWLTLGYPLPVAVASDKLGGTLWTVAGARNYLRGRPIDWSLVLGLAASGAVGAYLGARVTMALDARVVARVVGGIIVAVVLLMALRPTVGVEPGPVRWGRASVAGAGIPLGFYEGLLGSGNSIFVSLLLVGARGLDLIRALGHYYLVASVWSALSGAVYWSSGLFEPGLAIPAAAGAIAGGYLGSRAGNRFGVRVVRGIFVVAGLVLGLKLLIGW